MMTKMLDSPSEDVQSRMHSPQTRLKTGFGDRGDFDELGTGQEIPIHKENPLNSVVFGHGEAGLLESDQGRSLWMIQV
jgi:hypothetical protein